jgi:hypothetical protein
MSKPIKFTGNLSKILVVSRYEQDIVLNKAENGNFVVVNKSDDPMTLRQKLRTLRAVWKWL